MGTYAFVDDECTFDLTHTERLVVIVKGDLIGVDTAFQRKQSLKEQMVLSNGMDDVCRCRPNQIRLRELNGRGYF